MQGMCEDNNKKPNTANYQAPIRVLFSPPQGFKLCNRLTQAIVVNLDESTES